MNIQFLTLGGGFGQKMNTLNAKLMLLHMMCYLLQLLYNVNILAHTLHIIIIIFIGSGSVIPCDPDLNSNNN